MCIRDRWSTDLAPPPVDFPVDVLLLPVILLVHVLLLAAATALVVVLIVLDPDILLEGRSPPKVEVAVVRSRLFFERLIISNDLS